MKRRISLRRRTRLRSASRKYAKELARYSRRRKTWLPEHPECEIRPILFAAGFLTICYHHTNQIHHRKGRGKHLNEEEWWLASCSGECHKWIKNNPKEARRIGLILPP